MAWRQQETTHPGKHNKPIHDGRVGWRHSHLSTLPPTTRAQSTASMAALDTGCLLPASHRPTNVATLADRTWHQRAVPADPQSRCTPRCVAPSRLGDGGGWVERGWHRRVVRVSNGSWPEPGPGPGRPPPVASPLHRPLWNFGRRRRRRRHWAEADALRTPR